MNCTQLASRIFGCRWGCSVYAVCNSGEGGGAGNCFLSFYFEGRGRDGLLL